MTEDRPPTPAEVERQVSQHAESLRAAGVEWLPNAPLPPAPRTEPRPAAAPAPEPLAAALQPVLFGLGADAPGGALTPEQRGHELAALAQRVAGCTRCAGLVVSRTQTVFGVGPLDPELCFVGEAPGADEDAQGEPFVGQAGQLLNRIIAACGMRREDVYICNILRCRPPGNRTPLPQEAANCREYLERTLELVRPKFLCALGACAAQNLLGTTLGIGKLRGRFHDYKGTPVLCTYHPAFLLPNRSPERKKDVWEDMQKLLARMGRAPPAR
jgi:DNA polymerase